MFSCIISSLQLMERMFLLVSRIRVVVGFDTQNLASSSLVFDKKESAFLRKGIRKDGKISVGPSECFEGHRVDPNISPLQFS